MPWALLIPLAFLSGSIPFGLLIARARGIDIRKHGSGNIGATNVWRVLGRGPGLLCFVLDVLKGLAPTLLAGWWAGLLNSNIREPRQSWLWLAVMAAPILGHMFTPFAGFRGGKGVATALGAMLGVFPWLTVPALICLAIWLAAAAVTRYVSAASCVAALALPLCVAALHRDRILSPGLFPFLLVTSVLAALVIFKHRANLRRLMKGTENRIGARRP
jgi:glycerol-3-phosphate acyltransferase PlsY